MPPKMELANALRFIVILIVTYEKKANMQFSRKLLTSLFIGQYNVEKTQIPPPPLCQPRCRLIKKKKNRTKHKKQQENIARTNNFS